MKFFKKAQINALLKLYRSCVLPVLIYGCETWILKDNEVKLPNNIQVKTFKKKFKLLTSTPIFTPIPISVSP